MKTKLMASIVAGLLFIMSTTEVGANDNAPKVAVIHGSRYGSTAATAKWIAEGIGKNAEVIAAKDATDLTAYEFIVLGAGIYGGQPQEDMAALLERSKAAIKDKVIAVFVVCGAPPPEDKAYADRLVALSGAKPTVLTRGFRGWQKKELLSATDKTALENYYRQIGKPFENYDHTDQAKSIAFGKEIKSALTASAPQKNKP
jgi:menaquinone-dependent protoporphyrinogen IX oxidase